MRVQTLLIQKDEEINTLRRKLVERKSVSWHPPFYWVENEGRRDGPFCQRCYDKDRELIRLQDLKNGYWSCLACKSVYGTQSSGAAEADSSDRYDPFTW